MQLSHYKPRIIEKTITTEEGVFLARFVVVSEGNSFKLKLVGMTAVEMRSENIPSSQILLIEAPRTNQTDTEIVPSAIKVISPFSNLLFFVSQPTRAPSFR